MELATPPPAGTVTTSPRPPIVPSKLRLMCSYGGHILPRPHDKSLFYAGGETRIVALDRRTTAASLSALSAHLSRALLNNRPFLLKYQLPSEDLDSLISVLTDEDLSNMLEEHDRIDPPARIRLFLFPVKPESLGSALLDPKSDTWFSDALKSTGVLQKGQSADSGLLMSIVPDLETPLESGCIGGGSGGEGKLSAESLVLETSSSFGSTSSSFSMSNSPPIGINQCDEKGVKLDRSIRVPSSASIESEIRLASLSAPPPKPGFLQEPLIQLPDGKKQQSETQLIQGGLHYIPQYPGPVQIPPYYPLYQTPILPQHISCPPNQPYPIYLVPVTPSQYPNMSMLYNSSDANTTTTTSVLPPLHPQATLPAQPKVHPAATQLVGLPSDQGLSVGPPEPQTALESVNTTASEGNEFDEDIVYNQIYKTQPLAPVVTPQNQTMTTGMKLVEPSVQFQQKKPC
ncbi:Octicosapeptide/Phox/Bem1p family protein [Striga hermonthica]|uniref:Octicosapeptide/Phox/Bem1p family protein n=1 Tax=Striga hermonthica TaxID=68872 RepID=A0A9N7NV77_STRHE|nr:Octicosapeptide/Phox/Bem1p family protein [Striga hermonthica]